MTKGNTMALHVDCSVCPARPRACGDCSVGLLLGPVVVAAPSVPSSGPTRVRAPEGRVESSTITADPGLHEAIAAFAGEGMLPRLRIVPDQVKRAG